MEFRKEITSRLCQRDEGTNVGGKSNSDPHSGTKERIWEGNKIQTSTAVRRNGFGREIRSRPFQRYEGSVLGGKAAPEHHSGTKERVREGKQI